MTNGNTPDKVTLTWSEGMLAASIGAYRHLGALKKGLTPGAGLPSNEQGWEINIEGTCGEIAFAKLFGVYWPASVDTFKTKADVGKFEVRTRSKNDWDLIIRPNDSDDAVFILVTGKYPDYLVHGWMKAGEAKQHPEWIRDYAGRQDAWFVPQKALHPMSELGVLV